MKITKKLLVIIAIISSNCFGAKVIKLSEDMKDTYKEFTISVGENGRVYCSDEAGLDSEIVKSGGIEVFKILLPFISKSFVIIPLGVYLFLDNGDIVQLIPFSKSNFKIKESGFKVKIYGQGFKVEKFYAKKDDESFVKISK